MWPQRGSVAIKEHGFGNDCMLRHYWAQVVSCWPEDGAVDLPETRWHLLMQDFEYRIFIWNQVFRCDVLAYFYVLRSAQILVLLTERVYFLQRVTADLHGAVVGTINFGDWVGHPEASSRQRKKCLATWPSPPRNLKQVFQQKLSPLFLFTPYVWHHGPDGLLSDILNLR